MKFAKVLIATALVTASTFSFAQEIMNTPSPQTEKTPTCFLHCYNKLSGKLLKTFDVPGTTTATFGGPVCKPTGGKKAKADVLQQCKKEFPKKCANKQSCYILDSIGPSG